MHRWIMYCGMIIRPIQWEKKYQSKEQSSRSPPNTMTIVDNIDFSYKLHEEREKGEDDGREGQGTSIHDGSR